MITPAYCQMMARYNAWQNSQIQAVCEDLSAEELAQERGAFFGSILGTLSHLLWGDMIWMTRLDGGDPPPVPGTESASLCVSFNDWAEQRANMDKRILAWSEDVSSEELGGDFTWYSGVLRADVSREKAMCITHMFNHQTHHRGQVHAMLTSIGKDPGATDIIFMPAEGTWL